MAGRIPTTCSGAAAKEMGLRLIDLENGKDLQTGRPGRAAKHIWDNHREIIRLLVCGWGPKDIAKHLGCTPQTVINAKNSPIVQRQIEIMRGARDAEALDVAIEIKNLAPKALKVLEELMETSPKDSVRASAAMDLLDRAGFGAPKKIEAVHAHLTKDEIEEMRKRMQDAVAGGYVEVTDEYTE